MKLSVVVATYNEERNIGDCLASIKQLADEIVIVDGGSSDQTVNVVSHYTTKIHITNNPPIFHINKQKAIDMAGGEWVLQLDADERVPKELADEIKEVISNPLSLNGYYLSRRNFFMGRFLKKGGQYPDSVIRLIRKGKGYLPCKSVHEQMIVEGPIGTLKHDLWHLANPHFSTYLIHSDRYTTLTAHEMLKQETDGIITFWRYVVWKPTVTFLSLYIRHKGFMDGFPGFVFSYYSGLHFITSYVKFWEKVHAHRS